MKFTRDNLFWWASLLFFGSGATGLAYEVIWFKRFTHVWGSSGIALAAVVSSFLFGLGLGAHLWGRWVDRLERPLAWYGACEIAIGGFALVIPWAIQGLFHLSAELSGLMGGHIVWQFLIRFAVTLVVLGPPCVLMGGTLPLLVRQFTRRDGSLAESAGWFYGINTLGAATGCYLAGFHLLPAWGLYWTNNATALANVVIGLAAIALARRPLPAAAPPLPRRKPTAAKVVPRHAQAPAAAAQAAQTGPAANPAESPPADRLGHAAARAAPLWRMYLAVMLTGAAALVLQMVWARQLATTLGGSTYAFTATLTVVLAAMAVGSLLFHVLLRDRPWVNWTPAVVALLLCASTLGGKLLLPWLCEWVGQRGAYRATPLGNALVSMTAGAVLELLPAVGMGMLFPLLLNITWQSGAAAGRIVGNAYAWNTAGTLPAAALTALVLVPFLGSDGTVALAIALYVAVMVLAWPVWRGKALFLGLALAAIGAELAVLAATLVPDPLDIHSGMYHYGVMSRAARSEAQVHFFREGPACSVMVTERAGALNLRVNGKVDASSSPADMQTQLGSGYLPLALRPDAREVLVIGFGSGTTIGAVLEFPVQHATCCEIEPAIFEAAPLFAPINHSPHQQTDRCELVVADGRGLLQGSPKRYDLIISEPSNPWMAGVSNLFTREFFQVVKSRLNEGGLLAQWIQTYRFTVNEYALVLRTLQSVFPHTGLIVCAGGADTILLASSEPILPSPGGLARAQAIVDGNVRVSEELVQYFGTADLADLLALHYILPHEALGELAALGDATAINTDLNLRLEFDAPLHLFRAEMPVEEAVNTPLADRAGAPAWLARLAAAAGRPTDAPGYRIARALHLARQTRLTEAVDLLVEVLAAHPERRDEVRRLGQVRIMTVAHPECAAIFAALAKIDPNDGAALAVLGDLSSTNPHQMQETIGYYRAALKADPDLQETANNLAWILATHPDRRMRNGPEALHWAQRACESTDYQRLQFVDTLAAAYAENGRYDDAVHWIRYVLAEAAKRGAAEIAAEADLRLKNYQAHRSWDGR